MLGSVVRKTLLFPGQKPAGTIALYGIPDPRSRAVAYDTCPTDEATIAPAAVIAYEDAAQRLDIGPGLVGIGIAPDSLIHSCDISLDGSPGSAVRVSPGNPLIGRFADGKALVTVPHPPPPLTYANTAIAVGAQGPIVHNATSIRSWPLRLELYYGKSMIMRSPLRAPMIGSAKFVTANTAERTACFCVDGRSKIAVRVNAVTANVTAQISGVSRHEYDTSTPLALDDIGTTTATITAGTPQVFSFDSAPMFGMIAVLITGTGAGLCFVDARAHD